MKDKAELKRRSELLKELRSAHAETVARTQELLKEHKAAQQKICQVIRAEAHSVPEVAAAAGLPAPEVLWHITAMKKYGLVVETGQCGDYYLYQRIEEAGS